MAVRAPQASAQPEAAAESGSPAGAGSPAGGIGAAVRAYVERLRGGETGSLPAFLGLIVLFLIFTGLRPHTFTKALNIANLINQASPLTVIAMGLVFVLLLGEIDLSAGVTGGTGAAMAAYVLTNQGGPVWAALIVGVLTGAIIGLIMGALVARLGIPSFVVTLSFFLGLQGVLLKIIGAGGTIRVSRSSFLINLNNAALPVWGGILLAVVGVGGYALVLAGRSIRRGSQGLTHQQLSVVIAKITIVAVVVGLLTFYLSRERGPNPSVKSIKGVPEVVVLLAALLIGFNFLLGRTPFGRHVYAVGGNAEAARRAGISVPGIKLACFTLSSATAAVGGLLYASTDNSVSPTTGGNQVLLYAVGAAVIGGTSLFGGRGKMLDPVIGGLVIATIINGLGLLNEPAAIEYIVTGLVLLVAASVDAISRRRAAATGRV